MIGPQAPETPENREIIVDQMVPYRSQRILQDLLNEMSAAPLELPFDNERMTFIADFSLALMRGAKGYSEIQALAYWMRRTSIVRLKRDFETLSSENLHLLPRGIAFHIPPANVDTIFVYSLVLSLLAGNKNIVRLSSRMTVGALLIIDILSRVLDRHPLLAKGLFMISYPHDDSITGLISDVADIRVIWGGDETIRAIRKSPLSVHATELAFADRFSMAAVNHSAYVRLNDGQRNMLAERFYNDTFWFDQLGCSSPRLVIWAGSPDSMEEQLDFYRRVNAVTDTKNYVIETSSVISKLASGLSSAIRGPIHRIHRISNNVTVVEAKEFPDIRGDFCGGGLFFHLNVTSLGEISSYISRKDQTLSTFGFDLEELTQFVHDLRGRGLDRIVPFGSALDFNRYWDGNDLLQSFTRRVVVKSDGSFGVQ